MRLSLEWLAEFVDLDLADPSLPDQIADALTMAGVEVEGVEQPGEGLQHLVVAEVLAAEKHPNADKLKLCRVNDGGGERQIVCGAPNVAAGQRVVLARPGVTLPGGLQIKPARIRGEESHGMICSERELGMGDDHGGILVLSGNPAPGEPAAPVLGLDDVIFDVGITPNRGDCLSLLGVSREVAAILGKTLKLPDMNPKEELGERTDALCGVEILDPEKCPRYVAKVIKGVKIGSSPAWMQRRLRAAGMRPISNVVDVTNYVMLSLGQPLHAFDMSGLAGPRIVVRRWRTEDGSFTTLDGQERKMNEGDLMICDAEQSVAIGGVMGGLNSEVGLNTKDILLESAYFAPATIRATRRRLNMSTEASYRFERGVDPAGTLRAASWAIDLIRQTAGGEIAEGEVDAHPAPVRPVSVRLRIDRASKLLGTKVEPAGVRAQLTALGMEVGELKEGALQVEVPVFRHDIEREIDLIEEVARRMGYGNIPSTLPATSIPPQRPPALRRLESEVREEMISAGFCEALNYSFVNRADLDLLQNAGADLVPLRNPLSAEMDVMRTTLLAGLLENAALNLNRGVEDVGIFEIGRTYHLNPGAPLPTEVRRLAALSVDGAAGSLWPESPVPGGDEALPGRLFDLKGALERMGRALHFPLFEFRPVENEKGAFLPAQSASIYAGVAEVGVIGQLRPNLQERWGIRRKIYAFELNLEALAEIEQPPLRFRPLPRFPASLRDLAIVVKKEISHAEVEGIIREQGGDLLESSALFDIYRDAALSAAGERSLAYSLVFRNSDRTLNDEEVDKTFWEIVRQLEKRLGARLRG